jgi:hypothetical protein
MFGLMREISLIRSRIANPERALHAVVMRTLSGLGASAVVISLRTEAPIASVSRRTFVLDQLRPAAHPLSGVLHHFADIVVAGKTVGALEMDLRPTILHSAETATVAAFVGQQIGAVLALRSLREDNLQLENSIREMRAGIEEDKLWCRALGILQHRYCLPPAAARDFLEQECSTLGQPRLAILKSVIDGSLFLTTRGVLDSENTIPTR